MVRGKRGYGGWADAYRSDVKEQASQVGHDTLDVLIILDETMPLAVGDFANDVKGVELEPAGEVAALGIFHVEVLSLLQEQLGRVVDEGLVLDQGRHGEGGVHASSELAVEVVVDGAEERRQALAIDDGLLDHVEIGLERASADVPFFTIWWLPGGR